MVKRLRVNPLLSKIDTLKGEEFYCHGCDSNEVHSDKPETGSFFSTFGHVYTSGCKTSQQYNQVVFAYCPECIDALGMEIVSLSLEGERIDPEDYYRDWWGTFLLPKGLV